MYKVFVENRPVIFAQKKPVSAPGYEISSSEISDIEQTVQEIGQSIGPEIPIYVIGDQPVECAKRLFSRHDPIIAAGGVVRRKKKLLFIHRLEKWDLPKGKIDTGESTEECAVREIEEECGITGIRLKKLLHETYHTYLYKGIPTIKHTYWYDLEYDGSKKTIPQTEEGISEIRWVKRDEIGEILDNTYMSVAEVIWEYLRKYPEE